MTIRKKSAGILMTVFLASMVMGSAEKIAAAEINSISSTEQTVTGEQSAEGTEQSKARTPEQRKTGWVRQADGSWYYYKEDGTLKTGWLRDQGNWYFLKEDGSMATSEWIRYDRNWYWLKADGKMASSEWITYDRNNYYFCSWGGMVTGFQTIDGKKYCFQSWGGVYRNTVFQKDGKMYRALDDGSLCTGLYEENGVTWKYDENGVLLAEPGWLKQGKDWYWFKEDGSMAASEWIRYDKNWYWLKADGKMASSEWITYDRNNYYLYSWGGMVTGFQTIGGKKYCFQDWGGVYRNTAFQKDGKTYRALEDGSLCTGLYQENGVTWRYDENGVLLTKPGWLKQGNDWYWFKENGSMAASEWIRYDRNWYWLKEDGKMASSEWITYDKNNYYFYSWGGMMTGLHTIDGKKYCFQSWGGVYRNTDFVYQGKTYHASEDGSLTGGWRKENGKTYYYLEDGTLAKSGWMKLDQTWYWINSDGSRRENEMFTYDGNLYYVDSEGVMQADTWVKWKNQWYFARSWGGMYKSTFITYDHNQYYLGPDCVMVTGWQKINGNTYYFLSWGGMVTGTQTIDGQVYRFDGNGCLTDDNDANSGTADAKIGVKTIRNYLANAMLPVGNTLYIWGGGHDDADATRNGMNPGWQNFFNSQDASYNYANHRYEYGKGLDCSGYVGWVSYQVMQKYATTTSTETPGYYQNKGWGTCKTNDTSMKFVPGDIVAMQGHVWIVLGQCEDGSVVILHASPQYVQISGTVSTSGDRNSEAIQLADYYMKKYFPVAFQRYGTKVLSKSYMTGIRHFSWSDAVLSDPEDYRSKKAPEILKDLLGE